MPGRDGTGPAGQGPRTGRGIGIPKIGRQTGSKRPGRMGGTKAGSGPGGQCVCPSCGAKVPHQVGVPCNQSKCPKCGTPMVRQ